MRFLTFLLLLALALPATAGTVYRWTDAKGTVHYSDFRPPAGVKFEQQGNFKRAVPAMNTAEAAPEAANVASTPASPTTGVSTRCQAARQSVQALGQTDVPVMMDLDGDGQAEPLTADTQQRQLELARAQERAFCTP